MLTALLVLGWTTFACLAIMHAASILRATGYLILLGSLLVPGSYLEWRFRHNQNQLTSAARELTGRPDIAVSCQRLTGDLIDVSNLLGYVRYNPDGTPGRIIYLRRETCDLLRSYIADPGRATDDEVLAVHVLTHEAMHTLGIRDEAIADCAAQQRDALTARLLGAGPADAASLPRRYRATGYPRLGENYHDPECDDGGAYDEQLPDPPWDDKRAPAAGVDLVATYGRKASRDVSAATP